MKTESIRLLAVTTVPDGKVAVQKILGELEDRFNSQSQEFEFVGLAYNRRSAIQQLNRAQPDVLLVDLMLPGLRSIDIISESSVLLPDMKILALTPSEDPPHDRVILALQAGALGYVSMDADAKEIFSAIEKILDGENYLPVAETYEVMRQAAPELLISAKERRANLIDSLFSLVPIIAIMSAFTSFLWRKYWGDVGIRVSDLGVDASGRITDLLMSLLVLLGVFGPILFINSWMGSVCSWLKGNENITKHVTNFEKNAVLYWSVWAFFCLLILSGTAVLVAANVALFNLLIGILVGAILLAHVVRSTDLLPIWLTIATDKIRQTLVIIGCLMLALLVALTVEVKLGPDLRTDGVHGFLAPTVLGLSARPAKIYDLDEKREPLSVLYIGGNADLYVLYDPCEKVVRLIPVGSSRVRMIEKVLCPSKHKE